MNNLRILRNKRKLKQSEIAEIFGLSQSYYCKMEVGKINIPITLLKKIAKFYETSTDYILNLE